MRLLLIFLFAVSAFASEDEALKLVETSKARREAWKAFREKVSLGNLCGPRDYFCFNEAAAKITGIHPEDLIASRSFLEPYYLRSIKNDPIPCGETCQHTMRAENVHHFLELFLAYNTGQTTIYNFKDSTTVRTSRVRAYMDLSALGNMRKHMDYVKGEYAKLDLSKVTIKNLKDKEWYDNAIATIDSGKLFSNSILCHLHPGTLVYDEILSGKSKVEEKYKLWLKEFDETARKSCVDQTPIEFRGMDLSTREYYDQQTSNKIKELRSLCKWADFACVRKVLRKIPIRYAQDIERVDDLLGLYFRKSSEENCDETCTAQQLLRAIQTMITFISHYDRQKLGSTLDWKKFPEERYRTITEDVSIFNTLQNRFGGALETLGSLDPAKIKDEGLKSELKSIAKDVSDFVSGKMLKDSVICTMEPWNATYDKYMSPYKQAKENKKFEQDFLNFKQTVCK